MTNVPPALAAALLRPVPAFGTDRGAVLVAPVGCIELRRVCRDVWTWTGEDPDRRALVRAAQA